MRHKGLVLFAVFSVVALFAVAAWGAGSMISAGSDRVFRGADWDVVQMSGRGSIDSSGVLTLETKYAEMFAHEVTISLSAGVWANVTGISNGLVSTSGMAQNDTDGSVTVSGTFVGELVGSASIEDNDGPSEDYHMSVAVNGADISKCEEHRSITVQASLAAISISCLLDLTDGDVVTLIANSSGNDITLEHMNWYLKEI